MNKYKNLGIPVSEEVAAGAALFTSTMLSIYDIWVLKINVPFIFKCPLEKILNFFNENISGKHFDVGVGSGYFLDKCTFPHDNPVIHLMDLNSNSLKKTSERISRYNPICHQWNVFEPIGEELPIFNSISICNFLHCLPGSLPDKEIVIKNLLPYLSEGGVFFGTTILGQDVKQGLLFKIPNYLINKMSVFSNLKDNYDDLDKIMSNNFSKYSIEVVGAMALFTGIK